MVRCRVKDFTRGPAVILTTESGSTVLNMDTVCGKELLEIAISDSGSKIKLMAMDSTNGLMVIATKVNGSFV